MTLQKTADSVGRLRTAFEPVVDAVVLEVDYMRLADGIVKANNFDGAAVACPFFINHYHTVGRFLLGAKSRQTDH